MTIGDGEKTVREGDSHIAPDTEIKKGVFAKKLMVLQDTKERQHSKAHNVD